MKKLALYIALLTFGGMSLAFTGAEDALEIGSKAPKTDLKMTDISGETMSLNDIKKENGVLVVFSCNSCPFVVGNANNEGWEGRYNEVAKYANRAKVGMVLVNSNAARRDQNESLEDMKMRAKEQKYDPYYVLDKNSELADAFGAKTTPHVYLFDKDMALIYKGAIDDNNGSAEAVKEHWLIDALMKVSGGRAEQIDPNSTRNQGCSIKRVK